MIKTLLGYFKPHMRIFMLDMCCALFVAGVDLAFPLVSRYAMYQLIPNGLYKTLFVVMGIVVLAYLLRSLGYYIMTYWGHTFGVKVEADIRADLFHHLVEASSFIRGFVEARSFIRGFVKARLFFCGPGGG